MYASLYRSLLPYLVLARLAALSCLRFSVCHQFDRCCRYDFTTTSQIPVLVFGKCIILLYSVRRWATHRPHPHQPAQLTLNPETSAQYKIIIVDFKQFNFISFSACYFGIYDWLHCCCSPPPPLPSAPTRCPSPRRHQNSFH